jgi:hypothetical protein
MYIAVVDSSDRPRVRRLAKRLGAAFVYIPCGPGVVLSTRSLGEGSVRVDDPRSIVLNLVMKLRWTGGNIGGTHGFLPPQRDHPGFWEAHHPDTGRRCFHAHSTEAEAAACAERTGEDFDGTAKGWRVRPASEWRQLGTVRVDIAEANEKNARLPNPRPVVELVKDELMKQARRAGLAPEREVGGVVIHMPNWEDPRAIRFRELVAWKRPKRAGPGWKPPIPVTWQIDGSGRVTGSS